MILTFAVLGMVLGIIKMGNAAPCTESINDRWGCKVKLCGECIITSCIGGNIITCGPTIE